VIIYNYGEEAKKIFLWPWWLLSKWPTGWGGRSGGVSTYLLSDIYYLC